MVAPWGQPEPLTRDLYVRHAPLPVQPRATPDQAESLSFSRADIKHTASADLAAGKELVRPSYASANQQVLVCQHDAARTCTMRGPSSLPHGVCCTSLGEMAPHKGVQAWTVMSSDLASAECKMLMQYCNFVQDARTSTGSAHAASPADHDPVGRAQYADSLQTNEDTPHAHTFHRSHSARFRSRAPSDQLAGSSGTRAATMHADNDDLNSQHSRPVPEQSSRQPLQDVSRSLDTWKAGDQSEQSSHLAAGSPASRRLPQEDHQHRLHGHHAATPGSWPLEGAEQANAGRSSVPAAKPYATDQSLQVFCLPISVSAACPGCRVYSLAIAKHCMHSQSDFSGQANNIWDMKGPMYN